MDVPVGVELVVATVRVLVPWPPAVRLTDVGLKLADAPDGRPEAARETEPLNPPTLIRVTV